MSSCAEASQREKSDVLLLRLQCEDLRHILKRKEEELTSLRHFKRDEIESLQGQINDLENEKQQQKLSADELRSKYESLREIKADISNVSLTQEEHSSTPASKQRFSEATRCIAIVG
jgi:hypothetical protein